MATITPIMIIIRVQWPFSSPTLHFEHCPWLVRTQPILHALQRRDPFFRLNAQVLLFWNVTPARHALGAMHLANGLYLSIRSDSGMIHQSAKVVISSNFFFSPMQFPPSGHGQHTGVVIIWRRLLESNSVRSVVLTYRNSLFPQILLIFDFVISKISLLVWFLTFFYDSYCFCIKNLD